MCVLETAPKEMSGLNISLATVMAWVARLCGLAALGTGALSWFAYNAPLLAHVVLGGLLVSTLFILALQSPASVTQRTALAVAAAVVVPVLGLLELKPLLGQFQWTLQWLHPAVGIGCIGMAEMLAKQIRAYRL